MSSLEDLEKKFIKSENLEEKELETYLEVVAQFCTVSSEGYVAINPNVDRVLSTRDKIHLILCVRLLVHELQTRLKRENPISENVDSEDLAKMLMADKSTVQARVSELKKERRVTDSTKGVYKATLQGIKPFLEHLRGESV